MKTPASGPTLHDRIWVVTPVLGSVSYNHQEEKIFLFLLQIIRVPITHLTVVSELWEDSMSHFPVNPSLSLSLSLSRINIVTADLHYKSLLAPITGKVSFRIVFLIAMKSYFYKLYFFFSQ